MSQVAEASRSRQHENDIGNDRTYGIWPLTDLILINFPYSL